MTSVSSVMGKAHRGDKIWYYLDDGLYGSYNGQLYDHVTYPVSTPYAHGELHNAVLSGPHLRQRGRHPRQHHAAGSRRSASWWWVG